jgi:hypothetical protein
MSVGRGAGAETEQVRANLTGAYVATVGVVIFTIAVFLDWASSEGDDAVFSGYEADSVWPFAAFLGIGFAVALLYAGSRAYRRQHRGLSLASMAVGIAVTLQVLAWVLDVPGAAERGSEWGEELGAYVGLLGAALWSIGSGMLAKEPEGDPEHDRVRSRRDSTA